MTVQARRRDATANRQKLLTAAGELFAARGVAAPLEAIAKQAQVSIGTLYNHFPTRDRLLDAVYPERIAALDAAATKALAADDPWQGFEDFLIMIFSLQAEDRGLNEAMTMRFPDATALTEACNRGFAQVGALIERAQRAGRLRADFTTQDLAFLIWATSRVIAATAEVAPDAWQRYVDLQLDGLRAGAAHPLSQPSLSEEQVVAAMRAPA
ncbi:TetR/AcrR family transcriptional regulator [Microlunatus soli]|uniref:DNA-binding transcriptional regulator, AcrR family n=1 Tax=Microlunatus soli TaxID=630515 RepID=A0A1H1P8G0_9ACTN|nr:TetR/AcrR family transcriptional regulator [Microlunatus soli]SDS07265.1 DNA-binding transcriptional regulator, AcrR family [Microlunatus soli]